MREGINGMLAPTEKVWLCPSGAEQQVADADEQWAA